MEKQTRSTGAPETINVSEIKKGFKRWKEKTSTSPSNRHLGHYKSLLAADGKSKKIRRNLQVTPYGKSSQPSSMYS